MATTYKRIHISDFIRDNYASETGLLDLPAGVIISNDRVFEMIEEYELNNNLEFRGFFTISSVANLVITLIFKEIKNVKIKTSDVQVVIDNIEEESAKKQKK